MALVLLPFGELRGMLVNEKKTVISVSFVIIYARAAPPTVMIFPRWLAARQGLLVQKCRSRVNILILTCALS